MACAIIEECIQMFLIILLHRCQCVNPCEYTRKRMTASAMVVLQRGSSLRPSSEPGAIFKKVTDLYAKEKRRFNAWLQKNPS